MESQLCKYPCTVAGVEEGPGQENLRGLTAERRKESWKGLSLAGEEKERPSRQCEYKETLPLLEKHDPYLVKAELQGLSLSILL